MRKRATGIVVNNDRVLLIRDRGQAQYSLPGGGVSEKDRTPFDPHNDYNNDCHECWAAAHSGNPFGRPCRKHSRASSRKAVLRELREETGLRAEVAKFLFHYENPFNRHNVYLIEEIQGEICLNTRELDSFTWRDGASDIPMRPSALGILRNAGFIQGP